MLCHLPTGRTWSRAWPQEAQVEMPSMRGTQGMQGTQSMQGMQGTPGTEPHHPGCCSPNRGARGTSKAKGSPTTTPPKGLGTIPRCSRWGPLPDPVCFRKCFRCFIKSISKIRRHGKLATLAGISTGIKGSSDQNPLGSSANNSLCTLHLTALRFFFPSAKNTSSHKENRYNREQCVYHLHRFLLLNFYSYCVR